MSLCVPIKYNINSQTSIISFEYLNLSFKIHSAFYLVGILDK